MLIRRPAAKIEATTMPAVDRPEDEVEGGLVGVSVVVDWEGRDGSGLAEGAAGVREEVILDLEEERTEVLRVVAVVVSREVEGSSVVVVDSIESVVVVSDSEEAVVLDRADDVDETVVIVVAVAEVASEGVAVDLAVLAALELVLLVDVSMGITTSAELVADDTEVNGSRRLLMPLSIGSRRNAILRKD